MKKYLALISILLVIVLCLYAYSYKKETTLPKANDDSSVSAESSSNSSRQYIGESGDDVNGVHTGKVKAFTLGKPDTLTIDYLLVWPCDPEIETEVQCTSPITGSNPDAKLRTFPVSKDAEITMILYSQNLEYVKVSFAELARYFYSDDQELDSLNVQYNPYIIKLENGEVVSIDQIYRP